MEGSEEDAPYVHGGRAHEGGKRSNGHLSRKMSHIQVRRAREDIFCLGGP